MRSIWDGWEKQFRFPKDGPMIGGPISEGWHCAITFLGEERLYISEPTLHRVANFIKQNYEIPADRHLPSTVIVYANNVLGLTPDDFRRIDRETQIAEGMAATERLLDSVPLPSEKEVAHAH